MKQTKLLTCAVALTFVVSIARAEEGGSAHYAPGATADFLDVLPGKPGFIVADAYTYYDGSATPPIDFAGNTTLNVNARLNAETIFGLYETPLTLLGGNYATAITIPYVWLEVDGNVTKGPGSVPISAMRRADWETLRCIHSSSAGPTGQISNMTFDSASIRRLEVMKRDSLPTPAGITGPLSRRHPSVG